jgi:hypothetical protein
MEEEGYPLISNFNGADSAQVEKKRRIVKLAFWGLLGVPIILLSASVAIDRFFCLNLEKLEIPRPQSTDLFRHADWTADVGYSGILSYDATGAQTRKISFAAGEAPLDDEFFERFEFDIVGMEYTSLAWSFVRWITYLALGLQVAALALAIGFGGYPTTLSFKVGSTLRDSWKDALPVWLLLFCGLLSILAVLLSNSSVQSIGTRYAFYAIREANDAASVAAFEEALDGPQPRLFLMDTLRLVGHWFVKGGGNKWAISSFLLVGVVAFDLMIFVGAFFLDTRIIQSELQYDDSKLQADLKRLPTHCRVLPLWVSILFFVLMNVITKFAGRYVNNQGRWLNRLPWTATEEPPHDRLVDDIINDYTQFFWIQPAMLVDGAFLLWIPLVIVLVLGSLHRMALLSKIIEIISLAYIFRCFSIVATILPSAMTLVQRPICYDDAEMSLGDSFTTSNFCNDMIYSGHSTGAMVCACVLLMMLIYGPYRHKVITIGIVCGFALLSLTVILLGRYHFTADVLIALVVCVLVTLIHAPALKLFFHYRRVQLSSGSYAGVGKIAGELERISTDIETLVKTRKIDHDKSDWTVMDQRVERIRQYLGQLNMKVQQHVY